MPNHKPLLVSLAFTAALSAIASPALAEVLKREPPMGQLREGQTVLVDDGSCPAGQVKKVTGGNHVSVGGTSTFCVHIMHSEITAGARWCVGALLDFRKRVIHVASSSHQECPLSPGPRPNRCITATIDGPFVLMVQAKAIGV